MSIYAIGAGGIGSWLVPSIRMLEPESNITIIDGDKLEEKNLNRQLFTEQDLGEFKAEALAKKYGCGFANDFFSDGLFPIGPDDVLMCCVDNDPGRMSVLYECDSKQCTAIFAANEKHSSEAFVYLPDWKGSAADPRTYYPEMVRDQTGDPRTRAIGCTGAAQRATPQLVTANKMASSLAESLYVLWVQEVPRLPRSVIPKLPRLRRVTLSGMESVPVGTL